MSVTTPSPPPLPPELTGYRLERLLGRGGFGEVWQAEAPGGVAVAVKIIHRTLRPAEADRELKALGAVKGLRHPYLLSLQAFHALEDRLIAVMELADGNLRQRLAVCKVLGKQGVPPEELTVHVREAAEALDFLHFHKVLHRDVKPDNLLLVAGHVKVADFGLARVLEDSSLQTASRVGTPMYMAPEVWDGQVTAQTDQYALASAYAELRTGRYPFPGDTPAALMYAHLSKEPTLEVPPEERAVLRRALSKAPGDRYPSCTAFAAALAAAAGPGAAPLLGETLPAPAAVTVSAPGVDRPRRRRRLLAALAVSALLLAGGGLLAWRLWPTPAGRPSAEPDNPNRRLIVGKWNAPHPGAEMLKLDPKFAEKVDQKFADMPIPGFRIDTSITTEFQSNGEVFVTIMGFPRAGRYEFVDRDTVRLTFGDGEGQGSGNYRISALTEDELTLVGPDGSVLRYRKVK